MAIKACRLEGVEEHERVLKPNDWNNRRDGQYRPVIGFTRDIPQASVGQAGHRMLQHGINEQRNAGRRSDPGGYGAPPRQQGMYIQSTHYRQQEYVSQGYALCDQFPTDSAMFRGGYRGYYEGNKRTVYQNGKLEGICEHDGLEKLFIQYEANPVSMACAQFPVPSSMNVEPTAKCAVPIETRPRRSETAKCEDRFFCKKKERFVIIVKPL